VSLFAQLLIEIWVIDEEGDARRALADALQSAGYVVQVESDQGLAHGGQSGRLNKVGMVLLGPSLAEERAVEAAKSLRADLRFATAAVVALREGEAVDGALGEVVDDVLGWPLPDAALLAYARAHASLYNRLKRLQASEAKLRAILESEPECVKVVSMDGLLLDINPAGLRMLEVDEGDSASVLQRPLLSMVQPAHQEAFAALHQRVCAGESGELLFAIQGRRGTQRWLETHSAPLRGDNGEVVAALSVTRDVTERLQVEARLREQATLLDAASDAIIVRDLSHRIIYWNRSAERIYGWCAEEVMGQSVRALLYEDLALFDESTARVLADGAWVGEVEHLTKRGAHRVMQARWALVHDERGAPKSILCINTDITEKKAVESQLLRAQRLESIGTLAGGIAHDLNNALSPIILAAEMIKEKLTDPDLLDDLDIIAQSAQRSAALVQQVLMFARGSAEERRVKVHLGEVASAVQRMIRDTFPKDITCAVSVAPNLWRVEADPTQMQQLFTNLCVNARDAMPRGGTLSIVVEQTHLDEVYAGMTVGARPGPYVLIRVEDSGAGMPPEVLDRVFEPFFTTKRVGEGTGLGLSTAHAIVRGYGGFMNVYSEVGKGTRFKVYLPAQVTAEGADQGDVVQSIASPTLPRGHGECVLIVDDEEGILAVARRTLTRYGYQVLTATNGAEAISVYVQNRDKVAVVITDMAMPIMDGPATIVALRSIHPDIKIIGSSGLGSNGNVARAAGAGVRYFVPKPYTVETLLRTLRDVLTSTES
jgi:two-component system, cell cycle sensor histidine kinase and response regulator CckA